MKTMQTIRRVFFVLGLLLVVTGLLISGLMNGSFTLLTGTSWMALFGAVAIPTCAFVMLIKSDAAKKIGSGLLLGTMLVVLGTCIAGFRNGMNTDIILGLAGVILYALSWALFGLEIAYSKK